MRARQSYATTEEAIRQLSTIINTMQDGQNGELTLDAGTTQTTIEDSRAGFESNISLTPMTANAAAAVSTTYLTQTGKGFFVLAHGNAATTDRQFRYSIQG